MTDMEVLTPCLKHIFLNVWLWIVHHAESARAIVSSRYSQLLDIWQKIYT